MKRLLTIIPVLSLLLAGCDKEPLADAIINPNPAYVMEDITFTNVSINADRCEWNMGDGTIYNTFDVIHYYEDPGLYLVTLKAFGRKSGVSTVAFEVDVIGSQVKIVVKEYFDEYLVPNASVILYPSLDDWVDETNAVGERITNAVGECIFTDLRYQRYYVDVWEQDHDNYALAEEDVGFIETPVLEPGYEYIYTAYVDYYEPTARKSTSRSGQKKLMQEKGGGESRPLKPNWTRTPIERK